MCNTDDVNDDNRKEIRQHIEMPIEAIPSTPYINYVQYR